MEFKKVTEKMPNFQSHEEARQWFKGKFQEDFLIRCSEAFQGRKIYFYHIVKNKDLYQNYMQSFTKHTRPQITNMDTFNSYSTVEISENGEVNIYI